MKKHQDFERFYREHYNALFYYALHIVDDAEACRDIVSEAMTQTLSNYDDIEPLRLKNYVYTLVHHKCVDYVRHQIAAARYVAFFLQLYRKQVEEEEWEEHELLINTLMETIRLLPPRTRHVLEQCYFMHKQYDTVALEMGISVSGVKKHIVTALKILRRELAKKVK